MGRIVITKMYGKDFIFLFNNNHDIELIKCINTESLVDNIYKGKIVEIKEGLKACFVTFEKDKKAFLSLDEFEEIPKCGDEIAIQIKTDALKTKLPQASLDLCIPGNYTVCHLRGKGCNVSKKLTNDERRALIDLFDSIDVENKDDFNWVLRTKSQVLLDEGADISSVEEEIKASIKIAEFIVNESKFRSIYSLLYKHPNEIVNEINELSDDVYDSIITDNEECYNELNTLYGRSKKIQFHSDEYISLKNLHSLETYLLRAIDKKVYLDCGGYIIIEPTEAMTVIDVNTGKADSKRKDSASFIYKVNRQAATEVAKQLKIRNISGMIMVDFINMTSEADNENLMKFLREELSKDKVRTTLVDMTPLGIVEITRKKVSLSLDKLFSR